MAYGKLAENARAWDSAKNGSVNFEDMNELQDQLKGMLGPRRLHLMPLGHNDDMSAAWTNVNGYYLANTTVDSADWVVPIPAYSGQVITEVAIEVTGGAGSTGGKLSLFKYTGTTLDVEVDIDQVAHVFDTGGTAYANVVEYKIDSTDANLPMTIEDGKKYFLWIRAGNASVQECRVWNYYVELQFGN